MRRDKGFYCAEVREGIINTKQREKSIALSSYST